MFNEQENKTTLNKMSDLEYSKNDTEMMRYRPNSLSYKLGLGGMIFSILAAFICLNSIAPIDFQVIIIILMNIVILLGGFLAAEKVKAYVYGGAIAQMVFGAVCVLRIFYVPKNLIVDYLAYVADGKIPQLYDADGNVIKDYSKILGASVLAPENGANLAKAYFWSDGVIRGVVAMILLATSAAMFIIAGVIGFLRAKKLHTYLESINSNR